MIDQETRRKMRIIGVLEAFDIIDAMATDPSCANMGFDERMRVIVDYVAQEKENASVKRLLQRAQFRIANADVSGVVYDGRPFPAKPSTALEPASSWNRQPTSSWSATPEPARPSSPARSGGRPASTA